MMTDLLNCSAGGCWFGICTKLTKFPDKSWMRGKQLCLETFPLEQPSVSGQKCSDCSADCRASSTHQPSLLILLQSSFLFSSLSTSSLSPPSSSSDLGWVPEKTLSWRTGPRILTNCLNLPSCNVLCTADPSLLSTLFSSKKGDQQSAYLDQWEASAAGPSTNQKTGMVRWSREWMCRCSLGAL